MDMYATGRERLCHGQNLGMFRMFYHYRWLSIHRDSQGLPLCLERILNVHKDIVQVLQTRRLTYMYYFGHVTRTGSDRCPHLLLHGYTHGRRPKGRPRKKWLDNIRDDCKEMGVSIYEASQLATNRTRRRNTVRHDCQRTLTTSLSPRQ